jgi:Cd2+/Zn2+-exporting ATPase
VKVLNDASMSASVHRRGEWKEGRKWPSPWNVASGVLLALSFFQYLYSPLKWVALGSVGVGIPPLIIRSIAALKSLVLDINILMLIAGTLYVYHSPNINSLFLDNFVTRGILRLWVLFSI